MDMLCIWSVHTAQIWKAPAAVQLEESQYPLLSPVSITGATTITKSRGKRGEQDTIQTPSLTPDKALLTWKCCGAGQFIRQLELRWVPFHGSSNKKLKGSLQLGLPTVHFCNGRVIIHVNYVLIDIILFWVGGLGAGIGCGSARPARSPFQDPGMRISPDAAARPVQQVCVTGGGGGPFPRFVHQSIYLPQLFLLFSLLHDMNRQAYHGGHKQSTSTLTNMWLKTNSIWKLLSHSLQLPPWSH